MPKPKDQYGSVINEKKLRLASGKQVLFDKLLAQANSVHRKGNWKQSSFSRDVEKMGKWLFDPERDKKAEVIWWTVSEAESDRLITAFRQRRRSLKLKQKRAGLGELTWMDRIRLRKDERVTSRLPDASSQHCVVVRRKKETEQQFIDTVARIQQETKPQAKDSEK